MTDLLTTFGNITIPDRARQTFTDAITVAEMEATMTPDRMVVMFAHCTFPTDDEEGFRTDHPHGWEGFVDFAVFDTTKEAIGKCPDDHEIYGEWTATC